MTIDYIVEIRSDLHSLALIINEKEKLGYRVLDLWKQDQEYTVKMGKGVLTFDVGPFATKG